MRKPITFILPADEAAQLCAMLIGMERYYELQAEEDGMDPIDTRTAKALAIGSRIGSCKRWSSSCRRKKLTG